MSLTYSLGGRSRHSPIAAPQVRRRVVGLPVPVNDRHDGPVLARIWHARVDLAEYLEAILTLKLQPRPVFAYSRKLNAAAK